MPASYARRISKKKTYRKKSLKKVSKKKVSLAVKTYVKKQIHNNIENKIVTAFGSNQSLQPNSPNTYCFQLILGTSQGVANAQRIGNITRIVKGQLKMSINLKPYDSTLNNTIGPWYVRCLVVRDMKTSAQAASLNSAQIGAIWRSNGVSLPPQQNILDILLPVNDDAFRCYYDKTYKFGVSSINYAAQGVTQQQTFPEGTSVASRKIVVNFGKFIKSKLKYEDNTASNPQNHNLYWLMFAAPADGATFASNQVPFEYHYVTENLYEDA